MASVVELGTPKPQALKYLVDESILQANYSPQDFKWNVYDDLNDIYGEEEVVSTDYCVVWSQGGIIKRVFRFEVEGEKVKQALLTWLPSDDSNESLNPIEGESSISSTTSHMQPVGKSNANRSNFQSDRHSQQVVSRALIIILGRRAHINYSSGVSHIIRIPFELDSAFPAPRGLVLQRKIYGSTYGPPTPMPPPAPPTSFWSTQTPVLSSTEFRPLKNVSMDVQTSDSNSQPAIESKNVPFSFNVQTSETYSRLYTLADPMQEIGLVTAKSSSSLGENGLPSLIADEELLYISTSNEIPSFWNCESNPLYLALTLHKDQDHYTLWQAGYVNNKSDLDRTWRKQTKNTPRSRRRSSYGLRTSTGATTPATRQADSFSARENFGSITHGHHSIAQSKIERAVEPNSTDSLEDKLASQLQDDIDLPGYASAADRRTSSWIARSELSNQESNFFSEQSRSQAISHSSFLSAGRKSQGIGYSADRISFGKSGRLSGRLSSPGSIIEETMQDIVEDEALESFLDDDLYTGSGVHDTIEGLRTELAMARVMTIPIQNSTKGASNRCVSMRNRIRVFINTDDCVSSGMKFHGQIVVNIMDHESRVLEEILLTIRQSKTNVSTSNAQPFAWIVQPAYPQCIRRTDHVIDANRLHDGSLSRSVLLVQNETHGASLCLSSSWADAPIILHQLLSFDENFELDDADVHNPKGSICRIQQTSSRGALNLFRGTNDHQRIFIQLQPRNRYVTRILDACIYACAGMQVTSDTIYLLWWNICRTRQASLLEIEWNGMVVLIFSIVLSLVGLTEGGTFIPKPQEKSFRSSKHKPSFGPSKRQIHDANLSWAQPLRFNRLNASFIMDNVKLAAEVANESVGNPAFANWLYFVKATKPKTRWLAACRLISALHLLREDAKLDITSREATGEEFGGLAPILAQIGYWMRWDSWSWLRGSYYCNENSKIGDLIFDTSQSTEVNAVRPPFDPVSIFAFIEGETQFEHQHFQTLAELYNDGTAQRFRPLSLDRHSKISSCPIDALTPRISAIIALTRHFGSTPISSVQIVEDMIDQHLEPCVLETIPEGVVAFLRAAVSRCQISPPTSWQQKKLKFVDRQDLDKVLVEQGQPNSSANVEGMILERLDSDIRSICHATIALKKTLFRDGDDTLSRLIFRDDKRLEEASKLLDPARPAVAHLHPAGFDTEAQFLEKQKEVAQATYMRTMSLPSGKGLLEFSARQPALTDKLVVTGFTTSTVIFPSGNTVNADKTNFTEEKVCWAWFHAGVEAGLSVPRSASGLDTSWFVLNKPEELGNRHAGLLLALGLNGHFKSMAKWLAFKYLTEKHNMTTVALLIGLSASFLGSMDTLVTKILSVHVQCLLPQGSADVNLSSLTQTAGVMGIGLLYYNTQHRRMSEVMLGEIEHFENEEAGFTQDSTFRNEGYRLAAGMALGFINVGNGQNLQGLHDMHIVERLLAVATGPRENPRVHVFDQATAGAIMAITLIFMKSNDIVLSRRIDAPSTIEQFDYLRPDMLLLRKLAAKMIMWETIVPTIDFLRNEMPLEYQNSERLSLRDIRAFRTEDLPFFNILAGLLWSIGLKFAGTGNVEARDLLIRYLDEINRLMTSELKPGQRTTWNEDFSLTMIARFEHLVAISSAVIMAGTGDLAVFRRLRRIHGFVNKRYTFGCHQAVHQAIGILFLGKGRYTFCTSNIATASLLCAFYPLFPQDVLDNQAHLQALRHLWVFATEARCLVPRDVETNHPLVCPITVVLRDGTILDVKAPCLLPEINQIAKISTTDQNYWLVSLDFENNVQHLEGFKRHQSIWLRSKSRFRRANGDLFDATLEMIEEISSEDNHRPVLTDWIINLPTTKALGISEAELQAFIPAPAEYKDVVIPSILGGEGSSPSLQALLTVRTTAIDDFITLFKSVGLDNKDRLMDLRVLLAYESWSQKQGLTWEWIDEQKILKLKLELMRRVMRESEKLKASQQIPQDMEVT